MEDNKYYPMQKIMDLAAKCIVWKGEAKLILADRLLAILKHRLEKAKDERSKSSSLNLMAYQEAKGRVSAYEEIIALIESGHFDKGEE